MNSKNEEYLDNLLQSLKKDSRSGIAKTTTNSHYSVDVDLDEMIDESSENSDLNAIGQMLGKPSRVWKPLNRLCKMAFVWLSFPKEHVLRQIQTLLCDADFCF